MNQEKFNSFSSGTPCLRLLAIVLIWQKFHFPATASKQPKRNLCSWTEKRKIKNKNKKQNTNIHTHIERGERKFRKIYKANISHVIFSYTYFFAANDIFLFNVYWRRQSCLYYYFSMFFLSILIQTTTKKSEIYICCVWYCCSQCHQQPDSPHKSPTNK